METESLKSKPEVYYVLGLIDGSEYRLTPAGRDGVVTALMQQETKYLEIGDDFLAANQVKWIRKVDIMAGNDFMTIGTSDGLN
jgi:hypothetical protein